MQLVIEGLNEDAGAIGLAIGALQAAAESRLRAARIYTKERVEARFAYLYTNVTVTGRAFSVSLAFNKVATDIFGHTSVAITWNAGATGTHGGDAGYVVSSLSQQLDRFLAAYLRVNDKACGAPAP